MRFWQAGGPESARVACARSSFRRAFRVRRLYVEYFDAVGKANEARALELIQRLIRLAPDDWRVAFELGQRAFRHRNWLLAVSAYKKSMAITHTPAAYNSIAYAQAMLGRFDLASVALHKCIELSPNEPNPRDSLGEILLAGGRFQEAQASFEKAVELDPKSYAALARHRHGSLLPRQVGRGASGPGEVSRGDRDGSRAA